MIELTSKPAMLVNTNETFYAITADWVVSEVHRADVILGWQMDRIVRPIEVRRVWNGRTCGSVKQGNEPRIGDYIYDLGGWYVYVYADDQASFVSLHRNVIVGCQQIMADGNLSRLF